MKLKRIIIALLLAFFVTGAIFIRIMPESEVNGTDKQPDNHSETVSVQQEKPALEEEVFEIEPVLPEIAEAAEEPESSQTENAVYEEIPAIEENDEFTANTCTISIRCDTIVQNIDKLNPDKVSIVPSDGIILPETSVEFEIGESVFDLLIKTVLDKGIHMEYSDTPMYDSAYIEGIANLYEFDCGDMSGWIYKVNGSAPNVGCSNHILQNGDTIEWVYTCNLGRDV